MPPTTWADAPLAGFDLETTSADPETARIVTACVASVNTTPPEPPQQWLVDPAVDIPAEATAIHGITTDHAREHGQDATAALTEIRAAVIDAWDLGRPIVAYNAPFDLTVLDRELRRHDLPGLHAVGPVIDPLVLDRHVDRYRRGSRKLTAACAHYQVRIDAAHDSTEDALAAARVAWRIAQWYPAVADLDWDDLFALQVEAHRDWATEFQAYLARKGTPERIDPAWPIRPVPVAAL